MVRLPFGRALFVTVRTMSVPMLRLTLAWVYLLG
jgi:hypothetical protein